MGTTSSNALAPRAPVLTDHECWCRVVGWSAYSGSAHPVVKKKKRRHCQSWREQREGMRESCLTAAEKQEWDTTGRIVKYDGALKYDGTPVHYGGKRRKRRRRKTRNKKRTKKRAPKRTRRRRRKKLKG